MAVLSLDCVTLFKKLQIGDGTDCSFVFTTETEDGKSTESVIYGHKFVLSAISPYFEAAFKEEWKGNEPIPITTFNYEVFQKLMKAIYLTDISFETLKEAADLYAAAHFYQVKGVLDMIRDQIPKFCKDKKPLNISEVVNVALKCQDSKLIFFSIKYFSCIAHKIIDSNEFLQYSFDSINFLYQIDDVSADEDKLLSALEKLVENQGPNSIEKLKSATGAIRFLAIPERISATSVLSQEEKDFLMGKNYTNFTYLSQSKVARKKKFFFSLLPAEIQYELQKKFSWDMCWVCYSFHRPTQCQKAKEKYPIYNYSTLYNLTISGFRSMPMNSLIDFLQKCKELSADINFAKFRNIDKELSEIFYID